MKYDKKYLREYISKIVKQYLAEAEEEEPAADAGGEEGGGAEENPFAAAGGDEEGGEEAGGEDKKGGEEKGEEGGKGGVAKPNELEFGFNVSAVKKYNKGMFISNRAVPKKITKQGIVATVQPDGVDILIGFDDITEITNRFFKNKK
jgi:hypothetical protein